MAEPRAWIPLLILGAVAAFGLVRIIGPAGALAEAERVEGVRVSQTRAWALREGGASVSVLPKRVPVAHPGRIAELKGLEGFHEYAMRCSSCHGPPDPRAYPARRWIGKVDEMREHIRRAGVMPPADGELDAARAFLRAASDSLRRDRSL